MQQYATETGKVAPGTLHMRTAVAVAFNPTQLVLKIDTLEGGRGYKLSLTGSAAATSVSSTYLVNIESKPCRSLHQVGERVGKVLHSIQEMVRRSAQTSIGVLIDLNVHWLDETDLDWIRAQVLESDRVELADLPSRRHHPE